MSQKAGSKGLIFGKFPAVVVSYSASSRECVIKTPAGDEVGAEIEYPLGDDSQQTEIKITAGDKVWCEFIQGDTRRALITGYRNPKKGNSAGTRKWAHDNIVLNAGSSIRLIVGGTTVEIDGSDLKVNGISATLHVHKVVAVGADTQKPT